MRLVLVVFKPMHNNKKHIEGNGDKLGDIILSLVQASQVLGLKSIPI